MNKKVLMVVLIFFVFFAFVGSACILDKPCEQYAPGEPRPTYCNKGVENTSTSKNIVNNWNSDSNPFK